MIDEKAFKTALANNMPYDPVFFEKETKRLKNFVSYYESCKEVKRLKQEKK